MESVFHISGCAIENQVKFATCSMLDDALTWWNGYLNTLGHDAAYAMTLETLKKKMMDKYYPRGEIKKLEIELWNLKTESKRKFDNNNQAQQLPKRQNVAQDYTVGTSERKEYVGTLPLCNKCKFHHNGPCTTKTTEKIIHIKSRIQAARDRKKSYVDLKRKPIDFQVGDRVMLKCLSDESLVIPLDELHVDDKLHFVEEPVAIMDREIKKLKRSRIPIIKVRWNSKRDPEFTWEREDQFKKSYPHLFAKTVSSSSN
nr:hypothetical protein [Tanacetum cinerariifolium]